MRNQKGITLIALIITIIVLLILSAVTINLTLGERGIFNTAQKAGKNYKEASDKELADLTNLEKEMQNAINGTGNGGSTTPEAKPVKLNTVTATNYGDYVNYPVNIGHGPDANAHRTDWRIFYNDGTYVYLISSYYLPNTKIPSGAGMTAVSGQPYSASWNSVPNYMTISDVARNQYKMSWNKNTTNVNIKCISQLLNTNNWISMVNGTYALDAIGTPTIEMWVESWNVKENTKIYYSTSGDNGYYLGTSSNPTGINVEISNSNILYFPGRNQSYNYWLASPSNGNEYYLMSVYGKGIVSNRSYDYYDMSVRPIVRLKADVMAKQVNGVWELE